MKACFRKVKWKLSVKHNVARVLMIKSCCRKSLKTRQLYQRLEAFHGQKQETSEIKVSVVYVYSETILVTCCL